MSKTILVTGGCGYIGSHTIVDLIENGYNVISVDDNSRSYASMMDGIHKITGKVVINYNVDMTHDTALRQVFIDNPAIIGVIHFAAYKAVGESVAQPLMYYKNNLISLLNLLQCCDEFNVRHLARYTVHLTVCQCLKIHPLRQQIVHMVQPNRWVSRF